MGVITMAVIMVVAIIAAVSADGICATVENIAIMVIAVASRMKGKLPVKTFAKMFVRQLVRRLERTVHRIVDAGKTLHFPLFRY